MSAATTSPFPPPSTAVPPPSTAASAATNHLFIHRNASPLTSLSLCLSAASLRHHDSTFSGSPPPRPLKPSNLIKPPFSFHGIVNSFNGFTHHLSNLIVKNPNAAGEKSHNLWPLLNLCPPAMATEDKKPWDSHGMQANSLYGLNNLSRLMRYKISDIKFVNPRTRAAVHDADESFGDLVGLKRGGLYTKQQLIESLEAMSATQFFKKIDFEVKTNPDGTVDINIPYKENIFPPKTKFRCVAFGSMPDEKPIELDPDMTLKEEIEFERRCFRQEREKMERGRACMLGDDVEEEIERMLVKSRSLSASLFRKISKKIEKWYHDRNFHGAHVIHTGPLGIPDGDITFVVMEGDIDKIQVKFVDKMGNISQGNTNPKLIERVLPKELAVGNPYNRRVVDEALRNLQSLGLFSKTSMAVERNQKNGAMSLDIILQEPSHYTSSELSPNWSIVPSRNGGLTLDSLAPGAKMSFGHKNINGLNRRFQGELNVSNLFDPDQGHLGCCFEYKHPYLDGIDNPRNRTFHATCFNTKKLSPVFRGGPGVDASPIWVDRFGVKANITENYNRQSKFTYGVAVEDIKTRGEGGGIVSRGDAISVNGDYINMANGPPTTLRRGTGRDVMAFLQANLTRDNTRFVNGVIVGERDVFQVEQGIGVGGFFNRHKLSLTRFVPVLKEGGKAVLVLNGVYGGCVGDLHNHEAFIIGGPHSVRGYEIGASRNKVEMRAEIRVAAKKENYVYAFAEHGNDVGRSVEVKAYRRRGHGSSYGVGLKLGCLRPEYAFDHDTRKGAFFLHFGDRF